MITRRSFMSAVAAGLGGLAVGRAGQPAYRIGLETYCFHDVGLDATLQHVRSLGLQYVELHDGHLPRTATSGEIEAARAAMKRAGIAGTGVYIHDAYSADEAVTRPILEFVRAGGFSYVTGGPSRESLPVLNRLAPQYGVAVALHNHGPGARYETLEHVTSALDAYPNLRAVIDIGHFARSRVDPVAAVRALGGRAVAIHVKDVDAKGGNTVVGEGTIDMRGVFRALRESRFDGLVVLEYEGDLDDMARRLAGMKKSLTNMHQFIHAAQSA